MSKHSEATTANHVHIGRENPTLAIKEKHTDTRQSQRGGAGVEPSVGDRLLTTRPLILGGMGQLPSAGGSALLRTPRSRVLGSRTGPGVRSARVTPARFRIRGFVVLDWVRPILWLRAPHHPFKLQPLQGPIPSSIPTMQGQDNDAAIELIHV